MDFKLGIYKYLEEQLEKSSRISIHKKQTYLSYGGSMLKIIVSPAKKMNVNTEFEIQNMPCFLDKTKFLMKYMQGPKL